MRFLREDQKCSSPRDRAVALVPFYAGARIAEIVGLDIDDVRLSARKGILRILGKGEKIREIPISPDLRAVLSGWIHERIDRPGADTPALFLNQRGGRLSVKGARDIITAIATAAGLEDEEITAHVYADPVVMPIVPRKAVQVGILAALMSVLRVRLWSSFLIGIGR
ncbi:MAG: integrase/recombinase XerD [Solirubrobacteraceae bacterium]|nr:integrase/recombinase XerD [Solirubrobacteraceae bacterium]